MSMYVRTERTNKRKSLRNLDIGAKLPRRRDVDKQHNVVGSISADNADTVRGTYAGYIPPFHRRPDLRRSGSMLTGLLDRRQLSYCLCHHPTSLATRPGAGLGHNMGADPCFSILSLLLTSPSSSLPLSFSSPSPLLSSSPAFPLEVGPLKYS